MWPSTQEVDNTYRDTVTSRDVWCRPAVRLAEHRRAARRSFHLFLSLSEISDTSVTHIKHSTVTDSNLSPFDWPCFHRQFSAFLWRWHKTLRWSRVFPWSQNPRLGTVTQPDSEKQNPLILTVHSPVSYFIHQFRSFIHQHHSSNVKPSHCDFLCFLPWASCPHHSYTERWETL
jgi:hypothetical protein